GGAREQLAGRDVLRGDVHLDAGERRVGRGEGAVEVDVAHDLSGDVMCKRGRDPEEENQPSQHASDAHHAAMSREADALTSSEIVNGRGYMGAQWTTSGSMWSVTQSVLPGSRCEIRHV